jgi:acetyltransferase
MFGIAIAAEMHCCCDEWFSKMVCTTLNLPARSYPVQYVSAWTAKDGTEVIIRPIRPEDEHMMVTFHEALSDRTVYLRYFCSLNLARRTAHERLAHICSSDYASEIVLVAERKDPNTGERAILAVGRLNKLKLNELKTHSEGEVALLVADPYQRLGLGTELLRRLLGIARAEGVHRLVAEMLRDNIAIQAVFKKCGFRLCLIDREFNEVQAVLDL